MSEIESMVLRSAAFSNAAISGLTRIVADLRRRGEITDGAFSDFHNLLLSLEEQLADHDETGRRQIESLLAML